MFRLQKYKIKCENALPAGQIALDFYGVRGKNAGASGVCGGSVCGTGNFSYFCTWRLAGDSGVPAAEPGYRKDPGSLRAASAPHNNEIGFYL